jgi:hypothetical protein
MKHTLDTEITTLQALPQTGPNGGLVRHRVTANLNLYAVVTFVVEAPDAEQAKRRADAILDECDPKIEISVSNGETMAVDLLPENVETELLEVIEEQASTNGSGS